MKLSIPAVLVSLFCNLGYATVKIENVPESVHVGQQLRLSWSSDRDYQVKEFALWQKDGTSVKHVHNLEHTWATLKGNHSEIWKVPQVHAGRGLYQIWFAGVELIPGSSEGQLVTNTSAHAVASSNLFEVTGAVTLFPKEIAGIVVGSVAAVALLIGLFVLGARLVRKRRSVAVDLPGPEEGGYTDVRRDMTGS